LKPKLGLLIVILAFLLGQANNIWVVFNQSENPLLRTASVSLFFLLSALFIFIERKNLGDFALDRISLLVLIFFSFIRMRNDIAGEVWFLGVIALSGMLCTYVLISNWIHIPRTNLRWAVVGIIAGLVTAIFVSIVAIESGYLTAFENYRAPIPFSLVFINRIVYSLSFPALYEEILFRGFIWGYLTKIGWGDKRACWFQAIFFWTLHWGQLGFPLIFFIALPLLVFVVSILRHYSSQIFPSILAHTIINALSDSILIAMRWRYFY
jgi:membrane protease YdiL (CAAX protease family)